MGIVAVIVGLIIYGVMHGEGAGTLTSTRPFWSEGARGADDYRRDHPVLLVPRF